MDKHFSEKVWAILACPSCGAKISRQDNGAAVCSNCGLDYGYSKAGSLDMRLRGPRSYRLDFILGIDLGNVNPSVYLPLEKNPAPAVDFSEKSVPYHLNREILSFFPKAQSQDSLVLDLGCGEAVHRDVCEFAGFEYVGLDYDSPKALILGDAHALPFQDNSFEWILSIAVLEHIRYPFVMMREAFRVLQPNGIFIGTVAFLEPFHMDSYYHHTHLGTFNSLRYGGFNVMHIAPSEQWSVLRAQAIMGFFPRIPKRVSVALFYPLQALHKFLWELRILKNRDRNLENDRIRTTTGSLTFIAMKSYHS